jgi:hypothetical protein
MARSRGYNPAMETKQAVLAGAVILGALVWWQMGHPGYETPAQKRARIAKIEHEADYGAGPQLYKWRDAKGVLQITDTPPKGRKFEKVEIRQDLNVVPMGGSEPAPATGERDKKR